VTVEDKSSIDPVVPLTKKATPSRGEEWDEVAHSNCSDQGITRWSGWELSLLTGNGIECAHTIAVVLDIFEKRY